MLCINLTDIAIVTLKGVDYHCIIHEIIIIKSESIHLLENPVVEDRGYIWKCVPKNSILKTESTITVLTI